MRGYDFIPDMVYSQAYDTYSQNPNFTDSMTMRVPVDGTVPRGYMPFRYTIDSVSRQKAGNELVNPFLPQMKSLPGGNLFIPHSVLVVMAWKEKETVSFSAVVYIP